MKQAAIPAFVLAGVTVVCATVLQATGHPSSELWTVAFTITGGAVGITIPALESAVSTTSAPRSSSPPASAVLPGSSPAAPVASSSTTSTSPAAATVTALGQ